MKAVLFTIEVKGPVSVQVNVGDHGAEIEDGLGSGQTPPGSGNLQPVADHYLNC
jgi:hypothetical protein